MEISQQRRMNHFIFYPPLTTLSRGCIVFARTVHEQIYLSAYSFTAGNMILGLVANIALVLFFSFLQRTS